MSVLAASGRTNGELVLKGSVSLENGNAVTVNGEIARTGRALFPSNVIATPASTGALIDLGMNGRLELGPSSSFTLNENGNPGGTLASGTLTVLNFGPDLSLRSATGDFMKFTAGETVTASGSGASRAQTGPGGIDWWIWALIIGGVVTGVVIAATRDGDSSPMSPVR